MHAWLWGDRREPDTRLILYTEPSRYQQAPPLSNKRCLRSSSKVGDNSKASDPATASSSRTPAEITAASMPPGSIVHEVHWIVLSSTSEYYKKRVTTTVGPGASSGTPTSIIPPFKFEFTEQLEVGQLEAAASVLQTMYTQELAAWSGSAEEHVTHLLLMLKVQLCALQ